MHPLAAPLDEVGDEVVVRAQPRTLQKFQLETRDFDLRQREVRLIWPRLRWVAESARHSLGSDSPADLIWPRLADSPAPRRRAQHGFLGHVSAEILDEEVHYASDIADGDRDVIEANLAIVGWARDRLIIVDRLPELDQHAEGRWRRKKSGACAVGQIVFVNDPDAARFHRGDD